MEKTAVILGHTVMASPCSLVTRSASASAPSGAASSTTTSGSSNRSIISDIWSVYNTGGGAGFLRASWLASSSSDSLDSLATRVLCDDDSFVRTENVSVIGPPGKKGVANLIVLSYGIIVQVIVSPSAMYLYFHPLQQLSYYFIILICFICSSNQI